jgi:hypothetical protein
VPVAITLKVVAAPAQIVGEIGGVAILGKALITTVEKLEVTEGVHQLDLMTLSTFQKLHPLLAYHLFAIGT